MRARLRLLLGALVLFAPIAARADSAASPAASASARAARDAARTLFDDGDFDGAYVKFQAAYDATNDARLLRDMALCEKHLRHYAAALRLFARYAAEARSVASRADLREAASIAASIEPFTATVTIRVDEPGADVALDDEPLGASPVAPRVVDLGVHRLRVAKRGFRPYAEAVPIGGEKSITLDVKLAREAGHLAIEAPPGAAIAIDGAPAGIGRVDVDLARGGHMVRVTAPGRRAFQAEVALGDHEARTLRVALDPLVASRNGAPELRVSVGCGRTLPAAPEEGLRVYVDGDTASEALSSQRRRWDNDRQAEVLDYAAYAVDPGAHDVVVRAPGCIPASTRVVVPESGPTSLHGALARDAGFFSRGPAGLASGWGIAVGPWIGTAHYGSFYDFGGLHAGDVTATLGGLALTAENVVPFFVSALDARYGYARGGDTSLTFDGATSISRASIDARFGPRVPLQYATIAGGGGGEMHLDVFAPRAFATKPYVGAMLSWWVAVSVVPSCDWFGQLLVSRGAASGGGPGEDANALATLVLGYRPGTACREARGVVWGLTPGP